MVAFLHPNHLLEQPVSSDKAAATVPRATQRTVTVKPLTEVLAALFDVARGENLKTVGIDATDNRISVWVPTEADVRRWTDAFHVADDQIIQKREADIGIVLTSATHEFGGWRIEVRHVLRLPIIDGGPTQ